MYKDHKIQDLYLLVKIKNSINEDLECLKWSLKSCTFNHYKNVLIRWKSLGVQDKDVIVYFKWSYI